MRKHALSIAILLLTAAALPAIAPGHEVGQAEAAPSDEGQTACDPGNVVDNEDIRIWFQGKKAQLQLFKKNSSTGAVEGMYQYKQLDIVELDDANETVAKLNLEDAEPQSSTCTVEESGNWTNVTYQVTDEVRTPGEADGPSVGTADVAFVFHFNETDDSAKFDLNVQDWPWQNETGHELAYDFDVTTGEDWVIEPAENGLGFRDEDSGEAEAFVEWAPNATAHYEDGHNETAIVDANTTGSDHHTTTRLRFTNVTAGYTELDYDPTVAAGAYVIVADTLIPMADVPAPVREPVDAMV